MKRASIGKGGGSSFIQSVIIAFLIEPHFQRVACVGTYQRVEQRLPYNLHQAKLNLVLVLLGYN